MTRCAKTHGPRRASSIALTFDDGPGAVTAAILEVLAAHRAHATFNVLGERIAGREKLLRCVAAAGHEVGVHGWTHHDHRQRPLRSARGVASTARAIGAACGARPCLFRPPFGLTSLRLEAAVALLGLRTVLWDVDPRDFEEPGSATICDRTLAAVHAGSIVLLHDDRPELAPTADALDGILGQLGRRGLHATTLSELFSLRGGGRGTLGRGWCGWTCAP